MLTTDYQQTIGTGTFNGLSTMKASGPLTTSGASAIASTVTSYFQLDSAAKTISIFGVETVTTSPIGFTTTSSFSPARLDRLDLNSGESYSQTFTVTTATSGAPVSVPTTSVTTTLKRTYLGQESVSVPAGTFNACKFSEDNTTSGITTTSTLWNYKDGITLKSVSATTTSELISASINGTAIK